jgi:polar amino acid transport system ATP-binding protein
VLENVALAPRVVLGQTIKKAQDLAKRHLDRVGLGDKYDEYPTRMSGGQQQRLAIARTLAMKPSYMPLDEVTSALDPELVGEVLDTLRLLRKEGMTMICVTHEMAFAKEVSDRVAFVEKGIIEEIGEARQVIENPANEKTQRFLSKVL